MWLLHILVTSYTMLYTIYMHNILDWTMLSIHEQRQCPEKTGFGSPLWTLARLSMFFFHQNTTHGSGLQSRRHKRPLTCP